MPNLPQVALYTLKDPHTQEALKTILEYLTALSQVSTSGFSAGMRVQYPSRTPPDGWILYIATPISRDLYPTLFAFVGGTYMVAGDALTTFRLPPLDTPPDTGWYSIIKT